MRIVRLGRFDTAGFVGQAIVTGATPKGAFRIVLEQQAIRTGALRGNLPIHQEMPDGITDSPVESIYPKMT